MLTGESQPVDIAIIAIRHDEYRAILRRISSASETVRRQRAYVRFTVKVPSLDHEYSVVLSKAIEQGTGEAHSLVAETIRAWQPQLVLVVGIGGAIPRAEVALGDVVVSTRILDTTVHSVSDGIWERTVAGGALDQRLASFIANLAAYEKELGGWNSTESLGREMPETPQLTEETVYGDAEWPAKVTAAVSAWPGTRKPRQHEGIVASSDTLVKDVAVARSFLAQDRRVLAVEMEAAGAFRACSDAASRPQFVTIRGISDVIGLRRSDEWVAYACEVAASFTFAFLALAPVPRRFGAGDTNDAIAEILIGILPEKVPPSVLAVAIGISETAAADRLNELESKAVSIQPSHAPALNLDARLSDNHVLEALRKAMFELARLVAIAPSSAEAVPFVRNCVDLAKVVLPRAPAFAYELFDAIDKPLKSTGDLATLLDLSNVLINAVNRPGRTKSEGECEARVRICGTSWVYQRRGRIAEAAAEAERAFDLAIKLPSPENKAFCEKCLGRLRRMQAELKGEAQRKDNLLNESEELLKAAIDSFAALPRFGKASIEVADCYILLGETYLAQRKMQDARLCLSRAEERIADQTSKEYFELLILRAELESLAGKNNEALQTLRIASEGSAQDSR